VLSVDKAQSKPLCHLNREITRTVPNRAVGVLLKLQDAPATVRPSRISETEVRDRSPVQSTSSGHLRSQSDLGKQVATYTDLSFTPIIVFKTDVILLLSQLLILPATTLIYYF